MFSEQQAIEDNYLFFECLILYELAGLDLGILLHYSRLTMLY